MLRIKLVRSPIGYHWRVRRNIAALGLRKPNHVVFHEDNATIRGMIRHAFFALEVQEVEGEAPKKAVKAAKAPAKKQVKAATKAEAKAEPKAEAKPAAKKRTTKKEDN